MESDRIANRICRDLDRLEERSAPFATMLSRAVELLHESCALFDWTGIYELTSDNVLRLGPFVGAPTEHVFIAVGNGVCGSAVAQKRNMNIPDVTKAPDYLACSAETRSELVVLIRQQDTIYGQIDIDSHQPDAFDDEMVREVEQVADRLALAYERRSRVAV
jgi:GAF domain-containing protein